MSKKFLKYQFRQYVPVLCVVLVYLLAVVFLYSISTTVTTMSSMTENNGDTGISFIYSLTLAPTIILPFFVYQYRTDKRAVDAFYQVPVKAKEIRRTRMIILLSSLLILFTVAFWLMVLILYVRQVNTKPTPYSYVIMYKYVYYIPIYFLYLICICLNFFIVSFLCFFR